MAISFFWTINVCFLNLGVFRILTEIPKHMLGLFPLGGLEVEFSSQGVSESIEISPTY